MTSHPSAPKPGESALVEALDTMQQMGRIAGMAHVVAGIECARSELLALRERCRDLEMMLRAAFPDDSEDAPYMTYGAGCDGKTAYWANRNADDDSPVSLDDDGTGLPLLTKEAREALGGKETAA